MFVFWYHVPEFPKDPSAAQACLGKCTAVALCGVLLKWVLLPRRLTAPLWCIWKLTMESCRQWNPNCHLVGVMSISAAVHSKNQGATSRVLKLGQWRSVINCSSLKEVSPPRPAMIRLHFRAEISSQGMFYHFSAFCCCCFAHLTLSYSIDHSNKKGTLLKWWTSVVFTQNRQLNLF